MTNADVSPPTSRTALRQRFTEAKFFLAIMVGKELVEIVEWNEIQEICKAMQLICKHRQRWNEFCYYPHPEKKDEFASSYRLNYDRIIKRIYLTFNMTLSRLAIRAREKGIFGKTGMSLEDAFKKFLTVTTYRYGVVPRERLLINRDVAEGREFYPLPVYSDVLEDDSDPEPTNFQYSRENSYEEAYQNVGKLSYCCDCEGICSVETCSCIARDRQMNQEKMYCPLDRRFILQDEPHNDYVNDITVEATRIMCGPECSCNKECLYRFDNIQIIHRFEVFKRDSKLGFGLRVLNNVKQGEPIVEFAGEVHVSPNYHNWGRTRLETFNNYSYQVSSRFWKTAHYQAEVLKKLAEVFPHLKKNFEKYRPKDAFIMPYQRGNAGRFISHGCLPNCLLVRVAVNDLRLEKHRLLIVANEDIPAGSELFIDYGLKMEEDESNVKPRRQKSKGTSRKRKRSQFKQSDGKADEPSGSKCRCGTVLCRENLPVLARIMEGVTLKDTWKPCYQYAKNLRTLTELRRQQFGEWLRNNGSIASADTELDEEELMKQIKLLTEEFARPDKMFRRLDDPTIDCAEDFKIPRIVQPEIVDLTEENADDFKPFHLGDQKITTGHYTASSSEIFPNKITTSCTYMTPDRSHRHYLEPMIVDHEVTIHSDCLPPSYSGSDSDVESVEIIHVVDSLNGRSSPSESTSSSLGSSVSTKAERPDKQLDNIMICGPFSDKRTSSYSNSRNLETFTNKAEVKQSTYKSLIMDRLEEQQSTPSDHKKRPIPPPFPRKNPQT